MTKCKRCGKCCYIQNPHTGMWIPCKYLRGFPRGMKYKTYCKVYEYRLGKRINFNWACKLNSPWNIEGCPFNNEHKEPHPFWNNQEVLK